MASQTHFNKFHEKIKLTREADAYKDARQKDTSILSKIREAFANEGYPLCDDFLQGSFSTNTAIQSLDGDFDIDHAIVIDSEKSPSNPIDVKKVVKGVLEKRGFKNAKIKKPCITADYNSLNLHIDIPVYRVKNSQYELAVGKLNSDERNREWAPADPKGLKNWINNTSTYAYSPNSTQQQFIRVIRYLKRWRDHTFTPVVRKKIFSIGLTVMAKQCFECNFDKDGKPNDLLALIATVNNILNRGYFRICNVEQYIVSVPLPVTPYRDIFYGSSLETGTQLRNKLNTIKNKLEEANRQTDEIKQCEIFNKLFGSDFVIPAKSSENKERGQMLSFSSAGVVGTSQGA
ncbi:TPA: cyclic GMP-AMP synthase DncV-like nucleotidyltransferase [Vibrio parahaemolyticus]|uniref:nucleotidyltransferase domain-containing protein n=1 Tax=Vibrio parahaemolyticus TaxID=670 RepID=UPI00040DC3CF|nr:nucleotidyltransferase [Vibrio parahaemolyticus]